jgi:Domain of unknown function (DUF3883)
MADGHWTDAENDLIVAYYFLLLGEELLGRNPNKSHHRRTLLPLLNSRSEQSIEFKHRNISAVMRGVGQPIIEGYKPAKNFQSSLLDAVLKWLADHPDWLDPRTLNTGWKAPVLGGFSDGNDILWIGPPPTHSNEPYDPKVGELIARKVDIAALEAQNTILGSAGEALVLRHERATLRSGGRQDLASEVRWVSNLDGDGLGYDIASFEQDGKPRLIEVKTTNGWERTPFHITRNELAAAEEYRETWCLVRVWNFVREPKAFELHPPLDAHVALTPTSFLAALR